MRKVCSVCGKQFNGPEAQKCCSHRCSVILRSDISRGPKRDNPVPCKVCHTVTDRDFCCISCAVAYDNGSWQREFYDFGDQKLTTQELIKKWHSEGDKPETIAQTLSRDYNQIMEVLDAEADSNTFGPAAGNTGSGI